MDPFELIAGPVVSGGLSLLGGLQQTQGLQDSIKSQEAFQERMSSTAFGRAKKDMLANGLNPAMMFGGAGAESTPMGSSAMPPNIFSGMSSSALEALSTASTLDLQNAQKAATLASANRDIAKLPVDQLEGDFAGSLKEGAHALERVLNKSGVWLDKFLNQGGAGKLFDQLRNSAPSGRAGVDYNRPDVQAQEQNEWQKYLDEWTLPWNKEGGK